MKKKLIEVSLPLEAINVASAREKSIRHGHPSTLHLWWARRPLAACRAVLFASLVDDPASLPEQFPTEEDQQRERRRLHDIIEELVLWENSNNERVLNAARAEIMRSTNNNPPPVYDPFAGGGSIPLEAQRLGLEAHASDLNPVAVLINKALIEIPPKFAGQPPVNPVSRAKLDHTKSWRGAQGLAADVRYYGHWMRAEARQRIGHLYPQVAAVQQQDGSFRHATPEESTAVSTGSGSARVTPKLRHLTVIAWLWARTVKCPNPTCGAMMPLVSSFALSTKAAKRAWVEPQIDPIAKTIKFEVRTGKGEVPSPPKLGRGAKFRCLVCGIQASENDIRGEFKAKRNGQQLMAIVAEGERGRIYLSPTKEQEEIAYQAMPKWKPTEEMNTETPNLVSGRGYGITHWHEIFTNRQLVALTTFSDLVGEAREKILEDARKISTENAESYAEAVATYLGIGGSKLSDYNSSFAVWSPGRDQAKATFARQALPMVWDFVEVNPFAKAAGDIEVTLKGSQETLERSIVSEAGNSVRQLNATEINSSVSLLISTDPPYYNSIGYADLSDFFYIWLRRSLSTIYPPLLGLTVAMTGPALAQEPTPTPAPTPLFTYRVAHDHRIGRNTGELLLTANGFEYRGTGTDEARHSQTWRDEDLKRIELKPREIRLTAYEAARYPLVPKQIPRSKGGKELRLGSEREHVFQLTEGEVTPEVVSLLLARFPRPLASSVMPAESTAAGALLCSLPVFYRQRQGGASGLLRVYEQYVVFVAENPEASRFWRYADIRDIGRLGRYGFEIATYEKQFAADGKSYIFDLKRPLTEAEYEKLWARVYARPT